LDLLLWRHADAERGGRDKERRLTAKGRKQARRIAAWLRKKLPSEVTVLTSPARRAVETASALTDDFKTNPQLDTDASASEVLIAAGWADGAGAGGVVGPQPTLRRAAALILPGTESGWKVHKSGIWGFGGDEEAEEAK